MKVPLATSLIFTHLWSRRETSGGRSSRSLQPSSRFAIFRPARPMPEQELILPTSLLDGAQRILDDLDEIAPHCTDAYGLSSNESIGGTWMVVALTKWVLSLFTIVS